VCKPFGSPNQLRVCFCVTYASFDAPPLLCRPSIARSFQFLHESPDQRAFVGIELGYRFGSPAMGLGDNPDGL
jgi:hypothetical protein